MTPPPDIPPMSINSLIETPPTPSIISTHQQQNVPMHSANPSSFSNQGQNPTTAQPRKPSIEKYFRPPPVTASTSSTSASAPMSSAVSSRGQKRRRSIAGSGRGAGGAGGAMGRSDEDDDADGDAEDDDGDGEGDGGRYRSVRWASNNNTESMVGAGSGAAAVGMSPPRTGFVESGGAQRSSFNSNPNIGRLNTAAGGAWQT